MRFDRLISVDRRHVCVTPLASSRSACRRHATRIRGSNGAWSMRTCSVSSLVAESILDIFQALIAGARNSATVSLALHRNPLLLPLCVSIYRSVLLSLSLSPFLLSFVNWPNFRSPGGKTASFSKARSPLSLSLSLGNIDVWLITVALSMVIPPTGDELTLPGKLRSWKTRINSVVVPLRATIRRQYFVLKMIESICRVRGNRKDFI